MRAYQLPFSKIYELYLNKVEKKNRTKEELDSVIYYLTGHTPKTLAKIIEDNTNLYDFLTHFPAYNANAFLITGSVCGVKLAEITDQIELKMRQLDKLVDELAKGWAINKIFR